MVTLVTLPPAIVATRVAPEPPRATNRTVGADVAVRSRLHLLSQGVVWQRDGRGLLAAERIGVSQGKRVGRRVHPLHLERLHRGQAVKERRSGLAAVGGPPRPAASGGNINDV